MEALKKNKTLNELKMDSIRESESEDYGDSEDVCVYLGALIGASTSVETFSFKVYLLLPIYSIFRA